MSADPETLGAVFPDNLRSIDNKKEIFTGL